MLSDWSPINRALVVNSWPIRCEDEKMRRLEGWVEVGMIKLVSW
jgi:hypothetical protein